MTTRYRSETKQTLLLPVVYRNWLDVDNSLDVICEAGEKEMTDVVTPGFHQLVKEGAVINNPCDYTETSYSWEPGETAVFGWYYHNKPEEYTRLVTGNVTARHLVVKPCIYFDQYTGPPITFDCDAQAKSFCLANVDSTPYEFFEDLAELSETIKFLKNPLKGIADLVKVYKGKKEKILRSPWKHKAAEAKALGDLWSQYSFALAPLVRSVMTACEAWDNRDTLRRPSRRSAHGYSNSELNTWGDWWYRSDIGKQIRYHKKETATLDVHATIYYEVDNPLMDWKFALGLRAKDIPTVLWELMPLSFMLDRIVNVRNAIAGLMNLYDPSVTFLAASTTRRHTTKHNISMVEIYYSTGSYIYDLSNPDSVNYSTFQYKRDLWMPSLRDLVPPVTWKNLVSSVSKVADLTALIVSRIFAAKNLRRLPNHPYGIR